MELAIRLTEPAVADDIFDFEAADIDLRSIGEGIEAAVAQAMFTAREIEGVLALDDPSWQSLIRMSAD